MTTDHNATPDWWDQFVNDVQARRRYTSHVLTTHAEPHWDGAGTLTLTFPTWFCAVTWRARWNDDTLHNAATAGNYPIRGVRLAWRTPAYTPTEWPMPRPTPEHEADEMELKHADACLVYGIDSPEAWLAREAFIEAETHRRRERDAAKPEAAIGWPAKPGETGNKQTTPVQRPQGTPTTTGRPAPSKPRK